MALRTGCRILSIALAASLLLTGLTAAAAPWSPVETWKSEELGVRVSLPRGWSVSPDTTPEKLILIAPNGKGQLALIHIPTPAPEAGTATDLDSATDSTLASLKKSIDRFKLMGRREVEVDGEAARELFFRGRIEKKTKFQWVQTLFLRQERLVILMYTAPVENYVTFLGDYDQTVRSVRFVP